MSLVLWLALGIIFLVLDCLAQAEYRERCLVLWQLHMPCFVIFMGGQPFLSEYRGQVYGREEDREREWKERREGRMQLGCKINKQTNK